MLFGLKSYVYWPLTMSVVFFLSADEETCFDEEQARCENFDFFCGTRSRYMSQNCKLTCKMCEKGQIPSPLTPIISPIHKAARHIAALKNIQQLLSITDLMTNGSNFTFPFA